MEEQDFTVQQAFEHEFCPPLDPSLLAVLLADATLDNDQGLDNLRSTLKQLADQAETDEHQLSAQFSDLGPSDQNSSAGTISDSLCLDGVGGISSSSSVSSQKSFSWPIEFLKAALPHISTATFKRVLDLHDTQSEDIDMAAVIETLLTEEYVRELEERGLGGFDEDGRLLEADEPPWQTMKSKQRNRETAPVPKSRRQRHQKGTTTILGEVRQTQKRAIASRRSQPTAVDPWSQVTSLSTRIASLVPPTPPSFFQSFFHSPDHCSPYDALVASLHSLCANETDSDQFNVMLTTMVDILLPPYEHLESDLRSRLISEIQLAINVTNGRGEDVVDLVQILRELHQDSTADRLEFGIYHSPVPESPPPIRQPRLVVSTSSRVTGPQPPTPVRHSSVDASEWQYVPHRKASGSASDRLAASIPAHNLQSKNEVSRRRSLSNAQEHRRRIRERMAEMNCFLIQASDAWRRGNSKTRGGEIASFYAERARESYTAARKESLESSRLMVKSKWKQSRDGSVDLHGTSAYEAVIIVKDILREAGPPAIFWGKPLTIITGWGRHSINKTSVLKPAVKNALEEDGWIVDVWHGGLLVRGKRGVS